MERLHERVQGETQKPIAYVLQPCPGYSIERSERPFVGKIKLPYRQLDQESLNKVASGVHHEGVVMVVKPLSADNPHID